MTPDEIRTLVLIWEGGYNAHDVVTLTDLYAEDATVESPGTGLQHGRREIERGWGRWLTGFPDSVLTVEDVVAEGDRAAVSFRLSGTHGGEFLGLPATGKTIEFRGVLQLRLAGGLISHDRRVYDFSGFLIELGVLKIRNA